MFGTILKHLKRWFVIQCVGYCLGFHTVWVAVWGFTMVPMCGLLAEFSDEGPPDAEVGDTVACQSSIINFEINTVTLL